MGRHRKNPQLKGKKESPEKELKEIEASNLSDIEVKQMLVTMLKEFCDNTRN